MPDEARLRVAEELKRDYERLYKEGRYDEACPAAVTACSIIEQEMGGETPSFAGCINTLGLIHQARGAYEQAEPLFELALAIIETALGPTHPDTATGLVNLASLHIRKGEYGIAEPLMKRALAIVEKAPDIEPLDVATSLNALATLYQHQGAHRKAEPLFERALMIRDKTLGPRHLLVAISLSNLALLYCDRGWYSQAEPLLRRALIILNKELGPDHPDVGLAIGNIAHLYHQQGAYEKAKALYEKSLALTQMTLGSQHPSVATGINNLALVLHDQGAYAEAEPLYRRSLAIKEKILPPRHPAIATSLNNLAALYREQGRYEEAKPLFKRALRIYEALLDPHHPFAATALNNLAGLYSDQGLYEEATPLFERALAIYERTSASDHPTAATVLRNFAILHHDKGNHNTALRAHSRALDIEEKNLARALVVADESRRLAYASTVSASLRYALSLHLRVALDHDLIAEIALTTLLRRKNRVQDLVTQSTATLRRSLSEGGRHLLDELSDVDSQVAVLSSRGPGKLTVEKFRQQLDELQEERARLWSELAKHSALVEDLDHALTIEDVQRALSNGSVLLELFQYLPQHDAAGVRVRQHEAKPPRRYAAYLVFPDRFDWVDLGPAAPIDQHVKTFRTALQTKQAIPTDLYDAVMRPIVDKLGSAHHLIIAPAGDLSLIPFGALYDGKRYLIEKYDLRYLTTGRDLLAPPATPPVTTTPVTIIANPTGANLPDAELEADSLASLFPHTRILLDDQATETNVRTIERPLVLHMATHGFLGEALNERDNPLFRSGLALADIDQVEADRERDDGQLTAYEVSGMDLRGTQLVVLSACETGLGAPVRAEGKELMSEGIAGLRRAFAMAGARTLVMSLWEVSGVTTQKTMEAYYRKLAEGMGRGEAMQAVQLEMLRTKEHAHPKDWAAFIVSGDDTPMEFPAGQEPRVEEKPQGPPPVQRPVGCTMTASSSDRDLSLPVSLLGLLGLGVLRRRRV